MKSFRNFDVVNLFGLMVAIEATKLFFILHPSLIPTGFKVKCSYKKWQEAELDTKQ